VASDTYSRSYQALVGLRDANEGADGGRNEATTRLQLVNSLLIECLGWVKEDIVCEHAHSGGYADYVCAIRHPSLVVEAKREGVYFELPPGLGRKIDLTSITRENRQMKAAVEQVSVYAQKRGIPLACVCNGWQLVLFVPVRGDGTPPLEGSCFVFDSLSDMADHFFDLWSYVSKDGVADGRAARALLRGDGDVLPARLSSHIPSYPGYKGRNRFQAGLQIMTDLVLQDLPLGRDMEEQFLTECYAPSGALSQHALVSKNLLRARYVALFGDSVNTPTMVPASDKNGISHQLVAEGLSKRPIILVGDVGAGKTTFIRNLIKVEGKDVLHGAVTLYVDLGSQANLGDDLAGYIIGDIKRQLREDHDYDFDDDRIVRGIYHRELEQFRHGIYGRLEKEDPPEFRKQELGLLAGLIGRPDAHLKAALEHLVRGRKQQVICFLDNADQRSTDSQQQAFLIAHEMAANWHLLVYLALRPETFFYSTQRGSLSGYHPKAFTIAPPRIDLVVKRRLDFAMKIAKGEVGIPALSSEVTVTSDDLVAVLEAFRLSLDRSRPLVQALDNISGGNARRGLDLVATFLGSGHVDTPAIAQGQREGEYTIPLHQFLRAVIYGDARHFDPSRSLVGNLFELVFVDPKEHFLMPVMLGAMTSLKQSAGRGGFVEVDTVASILQNRGFHPEQIDRCMERALAKNLLQPRLGDPERDSRAIRLTTVGAYHFGPLVRQFTYVDSIIVDTPILDPDVRSRIVDVERIGERLDRAAVFVEYLDTQWVEGCLATDVFDWPSVGASLKCNIAEIRRRIAS